MIDIIVTTYNRVDLLRLSMESFIQNTDMNLVAKIIITDDGSSDGTGEYLETLQAQIKGIEIVRDGQRKGIIPRFNEAFCRTQSLYICEFQDDVSFEKSWLTILFEHLQKHRKVDFVSGFDAPEHCVCKLGNGYKIKPSSLFTQLLAKKETWSKWFPMRPAHNFPTPSSKNGQRIGSGIDCKIYSYCKNDWKSRVKFLVVPGIVHHIAEETGSTWRGTKKEDRQKIEKRLCLPKEETRGLRIEEIEEYWEKRSSIHQEKSVGFQNAPLKEQEEHYKQRYEWIIPNIPLDLKTLDYGCGTGRYSQFFDKTKYLGMDISENLLEIAKRNNPQHSYHKLKSPIPEETGFIPEMFFTATVLQHNCDEVVLAILERLAAMLKRDKVLLCLYENTSKKKGDGHICFRSVKKYVELIKKIFEVIKYEARTHRIHGEEHSLILVQAKLSLV